MKKFLVLVLLLLSASMLCAQTPSDVPSDHWAYDAVQSLISKGYISGYPDGTFKGQREISRYEFATIIKRIIDGVNEKTNTNTASSSIVNSGKAETNQVSKEDIAELNKLINEFKVELTVIGTRLDNVEAAMTELTAKVNTINAIVSDEEGPLETARVDIKKLKQVAISGYVQARYAWQRNGFSDATKGKEPIDDFSIRRARLKAVAKPTTNSIVTMQMDLGGNSSSAVDSKGKSITVNPINVKEAHVAYAFAGDPSLGFTAQLGQQLWPFGYELVLSSANLDFGERSLIVQRLFPGEYDRGLLLSSATRNKYTYQLGVFSGAGANNADNNQNKDLVGNIKVKMGDVNLGVSGYMGKGFKNSAGTLSKDDKMRYGIDVQYYMDNITLKGEWIRGKGCEKMNTSFSQDQWISGGYAQVGYNFMQGYTLIGRYQTMSEDPEYNKFERRSAYELGVIRWLDDKTRVKLIYQKNIEDTNKIDNDTLTADWVTSF